MKVEILTMDSVLLSTEAKSVIVPGKSGRFEMLENHAPIISTLGSGNIKVTDYNNEEKLIEISGGSVEMSNNKITILAKAS